MKKWTKSSKSGWTGWADFNSKTGWILLKSWSRLWARKAWKMRGRQARIQTTRHTKRTRKTWVQSSHHPLASKASSGTKTCLLKLKKGRNKPIGSSKCSQISLRLKRAASGWEVSPRTRRSRLDSRWFPCSKLKKRRPSISSTRLWRSNSNSMSLKTRWAWRIGGRFNHLLLLVSCQGELNLARGWVALLRLLANCVRGRHRKSL